MKPPQLVMFALLASSRLDLGDGRRQGWNRGHRSDQGMNLHGAVIKIGIEAGNVTILEKEDEDNGDTEIDHKSLDLQPNEDDELFDDDNLENENTFSSRQDPGCVGKCICIELYQPVCGSDGVTYGNLCKLNCVSNCVGGRVKMAYLGACSVTNPPTGGGGWRPPANGGGWNGGGGSGWNSGGGGWNGGGWRPPQNGGGGWSGGGWYPPPNPTPAFPTYPPPQPQKPPQYPPPQQRPPQGGPGAINCYYCNIYIQSK